MDKLCNSCSTVKPEEDFHRKGIRRSGQCKICTKGKDAEGYKRRAEHKKSTAKALYYKDPEATKALSRKKYKKNKRRVMRAVAARRRGFVVGHTTREWRQLKIAYGGKCLKCGSRKDITRDHVKPIKHGGTDHISNIQPLCRSCNSSKGTAEIDYRRTTCLNVN